MNRNYPCGNFISRYSSVHLTLLEAYKFHYQSNKLFPKYILQNFIGVFYTLYLQNYAELRV